MQTTSGLSHLGYKNSFASIFFKAHSPGKLRNKPLDQSPIIKLNRLVETLYWKLFIHMPNSLYLFPTMRSTLLQYANPPPQSYVTRYNLLPNYHIKTSGRIVSHDACRIPRFFFTHQPCIDNAIFHRCKCMYEWSIPAVLTRLSTPNLPTVPRPTHTPTLSLFHCYK